MSKFFADNLLDTLQELLELLTGTTVYLMQESNEVAWLQLTDIGNE